MRTTNVSVDVATEVRSTPSPCAVEPVTTANDRATPRWVTGIPAAAGAAIAADTPGTTSHGDAGRRAGQQLLAAAAEHERIAALQTDDRRAGQALARTSIDSISACGTGARPGSFPT